jgi:hypothetical protein
MSIEAIGLVTILIGLFCLQRSYLDTVTVFVVTTLLGSAAAILIGATTIQPAHLFLAFLAVSTLTRRHERAEAIGALTYPKPGFWLLCLVIYGVVSAIVLPRLLAGITPIIPLGVSEYADTGTTVPLGPVSSNFTQSVYFIADLLCFAIAVAIGSTGRGFVALASALVTCAAANVLFALLDLGTYFTGTQWLLSFMRNAQYVLHIEEQVSGLKRIVGSFPEASSFGRHSLGFLGFTGTLWVCGWRPAFTGCLALASLALAILSTSSTGLAGTPPVVLILYVTAMLRRGIHPSRSYGSAVVLCVPLLVIGIILAAQLNEGASQPILNYFDELLFSKATSASGIERASWNTYALQNFFDTYGLGVGLGTARTSSFAMALLGNLGLPGTIFYLLFAAAVWAHSQGTARTFPSDVRLAARNACIGLLCGDLLSSPAVEQGLLFYVIAGLACSEPERYFKNLSSSPIGLQGSAIT